MVPTSPAVKLNEDTLTYLNQGQSYEIKINKVAASPFEELNQEQESDSSTVSSPVYLSLIRLCFWDRKLQENELKEIREVRF